MEIAVDSVEISKGPEVEPVKEGEGGDSRSNPQDNNSDNPQDNGSDIEMAVIPLKSEIKTPNLNNSIT